MKNGYVPLYRKYRPQKIDDIIGQSHIKTALKNAIELNKVSHAYLFTGPRGTGKTSTARILAKSLNCVNGPTLTPCDECESCKSVINSVPVDVIEMDAASNRSVEDAQSILEKVQYAPTFGKNKIYIIDEIHMLSNHAFNALLKTLEEPPQNVIFIFATTEAHKVPDTIKSRCQRFDFKRITTDDITEHLRKISDLEEISISDGALSLIAQNSSGCMRDSLALLDQASILGINREISEDDINSLLGRISFELLNRLSQSIVESNPNSAMTVLEEIYHNGNEPVQILDNLLSYFKNLLIIQSCSNDTAGSLTGLSDEQNKLILQQSKHLQTHQIIFLINKTTDYIREMRLTTNQHLWLDVAIIDLANLSDNTKLQDLQSRIIQLESGNVVSRPVMINDDIVVKPPEAKKNKTASTQKIIDKELVANNADEVYQEQSEKAQSEPVSSTKIENDSNMSMAGQRTEKDYDIKELWTQILKGINNQPAQALFIVANPVKISAEEIVITFKIPAFVEKANLPEKKNFLVKAVEGVLGKSNIPIKIRTPLPDDINQGKVNINLQKKTAQVVAPVEQESDYGEEYEHVAKQSVLVNSTDSIHNTSDQAKMIKELFDGKYME